MELDVYSQRCETLKATADAYVAKYGQKQAALDGSHLSGLDALFSNSKVSQSLFIGYIVSGAIAHDVDWYISPWWAHFGIQVRAVVACLGVATLAMQSGLESQVNTIRAVPGFSKLDGRNCKQSTQVAWVFLRKMNWIRLLTRFCGNIVYLTFILGFLLDVYTKFHDQIDLSGTFTVVIIIGIFLLFVYCYLRAEGSRAVASMGYSMGPCGFHAHGPLASTTYTSGLPGPPNSALNRRYPPGGGGSSFI